MTESAPERRRVLLAVVHRIGEAPGDDLSPDTTAEQRLEMVEVLSRRMWELTGRPLPSYD